MSDFAVIPMILLEAKENRTDFVSLVAVLLSDTTLNRIQQ
jgi:hypothetical protein